MVGWCDQRQTRMNRMRVFSISVVKNEADVIAASLRAALAWSEGIFVLDNGSTDGTWEIIQDMAAQHAGLVAWKQWDAPFHEGMRAHVYNAFRHVARPGDWWCMRLDADEFYVDDPRVLLAEVSPWYDVVCKDSIEYRLTEEDLSELDFTGRFEEDRDKIRYYLPHTWREVRFFRHRARLAWKEHDPFPGHVGAIAKELVPVRHYKFRNPGQMAYRVGDRLRVMEEAVRAYGPDLAAMPSWGTAAESAANDHGRLYSRKDLLFDDGTVPVVTQGGMNPYRNKLHVRLAKLLLHGLHIWP